MRFDIKNILRFNFHVLCPLIFGLLIYSLFRETKEYLLNDWFNLLIIDYLQFDLKKYQLFNALVMSLPDFLWSYALISALILLWGKNNIKELFVWLCLATLFALGLEVLQFQSIFPGTFDFMDLIFISMGIILSIIINLKIKVEKIYESS